VVVGGGGGGGGGGVKTTVNFQTILILECVMKVRSLDFFLRKQ